MPTCHRKQNKQQDKNNLGYDMLPVVGWLYTVAPNRTPMYPHEKVCGDQQTSKPSRNLSCD